MKILLTGATGFVGSSVLTTLRDAGHEVVAVVRTEEAASKASAAGATAVVGDLTDTAWLTAQLQGVDGAIHTAATNGPDNPAFDDAVIDAVEAAFGGTGKPYVHTSGIWIWGTGDALAEDQPLDPPAITSWRLPRDARVLASGEHGYRGDVIAPAIVYGEHQGIPAWVIEGAPTDASGARLLLGDGAQHWTTVHVDDLAELYLLVLETAPGGEYYLGASGENPTVRELVSAVAGPEGAVAESTVEEAHARLGEAIADALLLSQQTDATKAKALGWTPSRPSLVASLTA